MVRYRYDGWGNHVVLNPDGSKNESSTFIGNINPFRYRGYYYDTTLKLYYLKTRYYDPETGRFITIDDISYLAPDTINGLNLYAYCGNNPVMRIDENGNAWWEWLLLGVAVVLSVAAVVVGTALSGGTFAILGGILSGAGSGFLIGAGGSIITQGLVSDWKSINPMDALVSGGIGAAIGAITGFAGAYMGEIGAQMGREFGYNLSNLTVGGIRIGKAFEYLGGSNMIIGLGEFIGTTIGVFLGGAVSNEFANNFFGTDPTWSENLKDSFDGLIQGWLLDFIYRFFKWIR